ncbi:PREDICTED: kinesin-like protein KIN-8A [Lupinus angustifolius]|uniref:kinesin-like protein KIN-8A n=1 Tax=Lupinus angustifolius TaxID=3871 RepID=UPI00092FAFF5|nr:PREDICTED: kinesin-like protein KIN-8A [Lupinus angustifolius]XP_019439260.1 PREDICTED: kinesin-like protein KIN-8A [Lupinus angustifolius]XP_019439265.1 PREDICTED: kinesin-like protein KIN-8A [Lupinus angustifolius]
MPVSTRSQFRNPHHGLKEKLKALTLLYEQQKQTSTSLRNSYSKPQQNEQKNVMRENRVPHLTNSTVTRTFVLIEPPSNVAKENFAVGSDKIVGFSCVRKPSTVLSSNIVARKLSLGNGGMVESEKMETVLEKQGKVVGVGESRILVFVRVRPMNKKEKEVGSRCCVKIANRRDVYLSEFANENDYLRLNRVRGRHFTFDASFPDSATQHEVYSTTTSELVEAVMQGRNGSVFCYGATGAGKTYTMLGTLENPGVMVLAIKDLFSKIRQRSCDGSHVVHLSYLEVYNETVRDLLSPGRPLVLREDKQGIVAAGLTQYRAYSTDEVMALLQQGNQNRTTEPTRANETSSRSHAILQVVVEYRDRDSSMNIVNRVGKLSLIDLAGSERAHATDQRTLRSLEGANINRSLLALSSCINALVEGKKHIPYRNSKLTQLLKDSLGGTCNTVMIANISPSNLSFGETQNTVHWADRAKEIRLKVSDANEDLLPIPETDRDQAKLVLELQKENHELRVQLAKQQQKLLTLEAQSLAAHSSPTPPSATSLFTPPTSAQPTEKRRTRSSFLAGTCITPESNKKGAELVVRTLQRTVKALEAQIERMKKDHSLQLKQKDDLIHELSQKSGKQAVDEVGKRVLTRASLRPKEPNNDELKSPSHRFRSPVVPTAKKRSYWDITTTNSPSIATSNGRKTRSHVISEPTTAPPPRSSMLLQPGFARQRGNI